MPLSRRLLLKSFAASIATTVIPDGVAAPTTTQPKLTRDEHRLVSYYKTQGFENFLMLNETIGQMRLIKDGSLYHTMPALSGRTKGDKTSEGDTVTPAGIFMSLQIDEDRQQIEYLSEPTSPFTTNSYLIHGTSKARRQFLNSGSSNAKRVSGGCINTDASVAINFIKELRKAPRNGGGFLVILPETMPIDALFGIPADFQP